VTQRGRNSAVAAVFSAVAILIIAAAWQMPPGIGNLPGPGFFPITLGFLMLGFAGMLVLEGRRTAAPVAEAKDAPEKELAGIETAAESGTGEVGPQSWVLPLIAFALMLGYVATWELAPFLVRTPLLVVVMMRLAAASWRATVIAAVLFPLVLYGIFALGLRVDLG
jgi:hypothetical protein